MRSVLFLFCLVSLGLWGCALTPGAKTAGGKGEISESALYSYLEASELAREEIVQGVLKALREGKRYRKQVRDQRNRWTTLTVWLDRDQQDVLHITTYRDEPCPACDGTGNRKWSQKWAQNLPFNTRCLECDGKGVLPNQFRERRYVLVPEDYEHPEEVRTAIRERAYRDAPPETKRYIEDLTSNDPPTRLAACLWLDQHYVREGSFFRNLEPLLAKARGQEENQKKKIAVYRFWAGKGIPGEEERAYYRIYVDLDSGKVKKKGFSPD